MPPNDERNAHSKKLLQKFLETKKLIKVLTSFFFRENPSSFQRLIQRPKRCRAETEKIKRSSIIFTVSRDKFNESDRTCKMWTLWGFLFDRTNWGLLMNDVTHFPFSSFSWFKISMANNILYWTDPILKMKSKDGSQWFSIFLLKWAFSFCRTITTPKCRKSTWIFNIFRWIKFVGNFSSMSLFWITGLVKFPINGNKNAEFELKLFLENNFV